MSWCCEMRVSPPPICQSFQPLLLATECSLLLVMCRNGGFYQPLLSFHLSLVLCAGQFPLQMGTDSCWLFFLLVCCDLSFRTCGSCRKIYCIPLRSIGLDHEKHCNALLAVWLVELVFCTTLLYVSFSEIIIWLVSSLFTVLVPSPIYTDLFSFHGLAPTYSSCLFALYCPSRLVPYVPYWLNT
jgi:hypothetical protein